MAYLLDFDEFENYFTSDIGYTIWNFLIVFVILPKTATCKAVPVTVQHTFTTDS